MAMIYKLVSFTTDQLKWLKKTAKKRKISVNKLIRELLFKK